MLALALAAAQPSADEDTVIYYDSGIHTTWWCSDRDSFGAAVRFTPREYPCEVTGSRAEINYDDGQQIYLRLYDDNGTDGMPGTILYNQQRLDVPHRTVPGFKDYDFTAPVTIDSGDFYIVWWQKNIWDMIFGTDDRFDSISRQWWYFPDMGWVTPMGMDAADHLIRAKVRYGVGIEEELTPCVPRPALSLSPNPARDHVNLRLSTGACRTSDGEGAVTLSDVSGRVVLRSDFSSLTSDLVLDVGSLSAGVYLVWVERGGAAAAGRLVVE
jgi:hypothetical protein